MNFDYAYKVLRIAFVAFLVLLLLSFSKFSCAQSDSSGALAIEYRGYTTGAYNVTLFNLTKCNIKAQVKWNTKDSIVHVGGKDSLLLSLPGAFSACSSIKAIPSNNCEGKGGDTLTVLLPCVLAIRNEKPVEVNRTNEYPKTYEVYNLSGQFLKRIRLNNAGDLRRCLDDLPAAAYILKGKDTRVIFHHP